MEPTPRSTTLDNLDWRSYYRFLDAERSIRFIRHDMPWPWINYLSNGRLHAFVSQAGGGFAWWRSPAIFRMTRWRAYNLPVDSPGFYVYIRDADGTVWSPAFRPCETPLGDWSATHSPGQTVFAARKDGLSASLRFFVTPDYDALVWDLTIHNQGKASTNLDVFSYVEFSLLEWVREVTFGYYVMGEVRTWLDKESDALFYLYHADNQPVMDRTPLIYLASTEPVVSYDGDRDRFMGAYRYERNPLSVERGLCANTSLSGGQPCGALHNQAVVEPGGVKRITFLLGASPGALSDFDAARTRARETVLALRTPGEVDRQHAKLAAWWEEHLANFACAIPDADVQRQINIWTPVQCVHTARYSRSVSSSVSGVRAVGFRDTCQDMLAMVYRRPGWALDAFRLLVSHQLFDGSAAHTIHPEEGQPPSLSVRCDDHLWLPMLAHAILCETGDAGFLHEKLPYLDESGRPTSGKTTAWRHLLQGMEFTETHLGAHDIPLTLGSDWNDLFGWLSKGDKGGESLFAANQYVCVLRLMIQIAQRMGDDSAASLLGGNLTRQIAAITACAWDGAWWRRGFDDKGSPIGSDANSFGKIFVNAQSWPVIAGVGTEEQRRRGLDEMDRQLYCDAGLIKLRPGFATYPENPDAFCGYVPGCAENGAIFCQTVPWAVIAEALMGNGDRAWKYYRTMIPHVAMQRFGVERYQSEPYAFASNIYGPENPRFGYANVNQATGMAAWMNIAGIQYILGIRAELDGLRIDPCLPSEWTGYSATRVFRGCRVEIEVVKKPGVQRGVSEVSVDGRRINGPEPVIPAELLSGMERASAVVRMGEEVKDWSNGVLE